ncbi:probable K(+)/H(+) antiporter subunit E [Afipia carboxidovorans OM5]|uniref:K+/H+ antiporter subunit E, putative PhaE n=1 Tax=Afipia carboxidovorans (strain ATCC 49405 / DSM 1227 / KCTC 32145 / OM5) TaxID=504832 RepID=B6JCB3_AFIC5|nr:Na+/H+ antiporter subunit E [Afipia carboxidovorans]ACI92329.1 probable K(+)/H(+) antiporter subunit E [Afipia carboxidovorans OM5]AEI03888.1 K+/H+ antiporter subunit E, putative PhaE [Afipia carboxidovorans OM4]AEI07465.1 K+/H+ antiporter subunit E, putative PhaE [Afipia carboxidovorans OM5]BEV45011.1 Na+/H+ antiporter subunit E [Afipia carboxidovorans]
MKVLPYPIASASLLGFWLLINQSLSLGQFLLGAGVGLVGGWAFAALELPKLRLRRPFTILRLATMVFTDIVKSNIAVAKIILGFGSRERSPGFVEIPLELRDPYGLAALACIITSTPGTLWVKFDEPTGTLTIHVLDLIDRTEWIRTIKSRYERPLMEIFA